MPDPATAEILTPHAYPIGTRRLCVDTGYYEAFNRSNVHLVDINHDPIERITANGIRTRDHDFEFDLIVFALGFSAFTGALDEANIRNELGEQPTDRWTRGPRTLLGLMTRGFPNLFVLTGPGSPSVLANMILDNVQHVDFVADLLRHMGERGHTRVEPEEKAQDEWTAHVAEAASTLLRLNVENYMVHVNHEDGTRVFMPYVGGLDRYVANATRSPPTTSPASTSPETLNRSIRGSDGKACPQRGSSGDPGAQPALRRARRPEAGR